MLKTNTQVLLRLHKCKPLIDSSCVSTTLTLPRDSEPLEKLFLQGCKFCKFYFSRHFEPATAANRTLTDQHVVTGGFFRVSQKNDHGKKKKKTCRIFIF